MTGEKFISKEDMSKMIDDCIEDLKDGGTKLIDLAHLMQYVGETKNDEVFLALFAPIWGFSSEILRFREIGLLPMIPQDLKGRYNKVLTKAIEAGQKALNDLKVLLCEKDNINYGKFVSIIARLHKHQFAMMREWSRIPRIRSEQFGQS